MINNKERIGNFTSSEIYKLMAQGKAKGSFGVPALTYIEEKNMERRLGRSLDTEKNARPLSWGKLCETFLFENMLPTSYRLCSKQTIVHPEFDFWSGSPDCEFYKENKLHAVVEEKCPMTLKSFCNLVDAVYIHKLDGNDAMEFIRENYTIGPDKTGQKYYWQIVSNAILLDVKYAELVVYVPYQHELESIIERARSYDGPELDKYKWIAWATEDDLPYLIEGLLYKNKTTIRFEIPERDRLLLTDRVVEAGKMLLQKDLSGEFAMGPGH